MESVVVVGGGPAGAATAIALAQRGVAVSVLEASSRPLDKVGESLPPAANPILGRLGLLDGLARAALPSYSGRARWGGAEPMERDFLYDTAGAGWRLDRRAFEEELATAARACGVTWLGGCRLVGSRRRTAQGWSLQVATSSDRSLVLDADVVVDASGRAARLARLGGVRRVRYDRLVAAVVFGTVSAADHDQDSATVVEATPGGWWYSLFLRRKRLVAAYLTDADLLGPAGTSSWAECPELFAEAPETWHRLRAAGDPRSWDGPRVQPAHTSRLTAVTGPDWLAVGDAAITFDPLSSYGITAALGAGWYAAGAVADHLGGRADALTSYGELIDHTFAQYLIMCQERYALERRWPDATFWRRRHG